MKCTNKKKKIKRLLCIVCIAALFMSGCGVIPLSTPYEVYDSAITDFSNNSQDLSFFAENLCVAGDITIGTDQTDSFVAEASGLFDITSNEVKYAQNLHQRMYPASTTKVMTAYIILKNCNVNDVVTVSENAVNQASDSSVCGLKAGDKISILDLLYGLLLPSGNDAAIVLAEYFAGSEEAFANVMNQEAQALGATNTHFTNSNGLPDENHYTTVYDMYLIFKEAIKYELFVDIVSCASYTANYTDNAGNPVEKAWNSTNRYLTGAKKKPQSVTVFGGKTGTTGAAGYCLVLYSKNETGHDMVSVVFKADGPSDLYLYTGEILDGFAN